jgi:DNA-binding NarL/FixJ family response regulator
MAWDVVIVGEVGNEAGALESVAEHEPDVVLLDLRLQGESGLASAAGSASGTPASRWGS